MFRFIDSNSDILLRIVAAVDAVFKAATCAKALMSHRPKIQSVYHRGRVKQSGLLSYAEYAENFWITIEENHIKVMHAVSRLKKATENAGVENAASDDSDGNVWSTNVWVTR